MCGKKRLPASATWSVAEAGKRNTAGTGPWQKQEEGGTMKGLKNEEITAFCSQMALMLHAGISSMEGLIILKEDLPDGEGKQILEQLYEEMEQSGNLAMAMKQTAVFPEYVCSMTEIGEETGRLDEVMDGLAAHYQREKELQEMIRSALLYPAVMLGMLTVVLLILIIKVLPVFDQVLQQLGGGLTGVSAGILRAGTVLSRYSLIFVILLALVAAAMAYLGLTEKGRERMKHHMEHSRITRNLSEKMACARVAEGLSLCIISGLDLDQSMELTEKLVTHSGMKERMEECRRKMAEGTEFAQALTESQIFSGLYGKMISVGSRTGSVDQVMGKIAEEQEEAVIQSLQRKIAVIEPTLVAVLSVLVGLILISVMLPLMSIMSDLG